VVGTSAVYIWATSNFLNRMKLNCRLLRNVKKLEMSARFYGVEYDDNIVP
jgi:hypothetical protein